jgi:Flp pilus assembly protein TadD
MILSEPKPDASRKLQFFKLPGICLLLAVATLAVFWPVVHCEFLNLDDTFYFTANRHVQTGLNPANIAWAFTTQYASNWHPLTWLSLMLDANLSGPGPAGPHFTNLLLHAANTVLLFLLLQQCTAAIWRSAMVAALFALHPLHVESVAWVAERKDVLSAFFGLLALLFYTSYARRVTADRSQATRTEPLRSCFMFHVSHFYWLSLLFFALGLMSKPMLVTLPFVMLLLDWWPLGRISSGEPRTANRRRLVVEKLPFFMLSAASCVVTYLAQQKGGSVVSLMGISIADRIENAFVSYARYLCKTIWPSPLVIIYPHPIHWGTGLVIFSLGLVIVLSVAAVWFGRKHPYMPVGWFWFVGTLIPVIGLVQVGVQSMADRYTYFPLVGVFLVLVWGFDDARLKWRLPESWAVVPAGMVLLACAGGTRNQLAYWRNSETLFRYALAVTENNSLALNNYGICLSEKGQPVEAISCFQKSLQITPDNADVLCNLGGALAQCGRWEEAADCFHRALKITPNQPAVLSNLGLVQVSQKHYTEARANFELALQGDPDSPGAHNNLATILFMDHQYVEAARHFRESLRLQPGNPQFYSNLGDTLLQLGQTPEAVRCYQAALRLKPGDPGFKARLQALGVPGSN